MSHEVLFLTTDGGFRQGTAGWAWVAQWRGQTRIVAHELGIEEKSTSARAELLAVIHALRWGTDQGHREPFAPITVVTDSAYIVECFQQRWHEAWQATGWINNRGTEVKNRDLWDQLLPLALRSPMPVQFVHVKGHNGHPANELCDSLCQRALDAHFSGTMYPTNEPLL